MNQINKTAMRAAMLIREQAAENKSPDTPRYLPEYSWNKIQRLRRQIDMARQRGWQRAAARLSEDLTDAMEHCRRELENALQGRQRRPADRQVMSASNVYQDILALYDEFEDVEIDLGEHELRVTTDRIVLEDFHLGAFQVRLDWHRFGDPCAYRVVALDPHPAAKSDDVTHPHVQDEHLCEGDGRPAIRAALAECRLHDFFMLVSQLLHNYGQGSAFVELSDWFGTPCDDCGASVSDDDRCCCNRCGDTLCGSCSVSCEECGDTYCSGCIGQCEGCGHDHCSSCLEVCPVCHDVFCKDCRVDGLCQTCHDKQRNEENEDDSSTNAENKPITAGV